MERFDLRDTNTDINNVKKGTERERQRERDRQRERERERETNSPTLKTIFSF